ncbi:MAG: hypothetical protein P4L46_07540 [Fimbriimonas sp.]|nr:hypothetical protein [Fimbriimonas sp.]
MNEGVVLDEDGIAHIGILGLVTKRISYRDIHAIEPTAPTYDSKGITGLTIRSEKKKIKIKEMVSHYRCLRTDLRERVLRTGYVARETEPSRVVGQFGLGNRWAVAFSSLLWVLLLCFGVDSSIRTNHGITNFGAFIAIVYWISISVFMIQVINLPMLRHRLIVYEDRVERYFRSSEPTAVVRFDEVTSFERPLYAPFYWLCSDDDAIAIPYRSPAVTCVGAQLKLFQASSSVN